jgi:hypothetical protein
VVRIRSKKFERSMDYVIRVRVFVCIENSKIKT